MDGKKAYTFARKCIVWKKVLGKCNEDMDLGREGSGRQLGNNKGLTLYFFRGTCLFSERERETECF